MELIGRRPDQSLCSFQLVFVILKQILKFCASAEEWQTTTLANENTVLIAVAILVRSVLRNRSQAPLYQTQPCFRTSFCVLAAAAASSFRGGRGVSTQVTAGDCLLSPVNSQLPRAGSSSSGWLLPAELLRGPPSHTQERTRFGPESTDQIQSHQAGNCSYVFWWYEIPQFLNLGNSLH